MNSIDQIVRSTVLLAAAGAATAQVALPEAHLQPTSHSVADPRTPSQLTSWIVRLAGPGPRLDSLRDAIAQGVSPAYYASLVAGIEAEAQKQRAVVFGSIEALGGAVLQSWWIVNACEVVLPADVNPGALARIPGVDRVESNHTIRATSIRRAPLEKAINSLGHNALAAHAGGWTGAARPGGGPQSIAVVDSELLATMSTPPAIYRHHAAMRSGGVATGAARVLVDAQATGAFTSPLPFDHGFTIASIAAGAAVSAGGALVAGASNGQAPGASLVSLNVAISAPATPAAASQPPLASVATLNSAWQWVLAQRINFGIRVAVNSFGGDPNPTALVQQSLDTCADIGDVLVVVPSGNEGGSTVAQGASQVANPMWDSQYAINGVVVGAVGPHTRIVPSWVSFSALTPATTLQPTGSSNLATPFGYERQYPDLVASGLETVVPAHTWEAGSTVASPGTSLAAPHVAGAAFSWLVGPDTTTTPLQRTSLMAKAALLASSENIQAMNPTGPASTFTGGYLRTDWLTVDSPALGAVAEQITTTTPSSGFRVRHTLPVVAGRTYSVAIAWKRTDYSSTPDWANLDLEVEMNGVTIGASASTTGGGVGVRRTWERVTFVAPNTGTVEAVVRFVSVPSSTNVTHAFAGTEIPIAGAPGSRRARFETVPGSSGAACVTSGFSPTTSGFVFNTRTLPPPNALKNFTGAVGPGGTPGPHAFSTSGASGLIDFSLQIESPTAGFVDVYSHSGTTPPAGVPCSPTSPSFLQPLGGQVVDRVRVYHGPGSGFLTGTIQASSFLVFDFPPTMRWWWYRTPNVPNPPSGPWFFSSSCPANIWPYVCWSGVPTSSGPWSIGSSPISAWTYRQVRPNPSTHWEWDFRYRVLAPSSTPVLLSAFGTPRLGATFETLTWNCYPNAFNSGFLVVGLWNPAVAVSLPVPGFPNCNFLVAPDLFLPGLPSTAGYTSSIPVPNDPTFAGFGFELQGLVFDAQGVPATSNGVRAVLGF